MIANFSAAIVFNYKDDILIPMGESYEMNRIVHLCKFSGGDRDDVIPSVFVGHTDGAKMMAHYTYEKGRGAFVVRLTDNQPFDINAYLLPFAIVVGICFIIMLGIMIFKCVQDRRRERRHRLPKSSLKKIPTKKFVAGDEAHYETCCICLDDYVIGDKLRILPCQHAYHMKCIDPWLLKNKRVCPQCRKKVTQRLKSKMLKLVYLRCLPAGRHRPVTRRARPRTRELRCCNDLVPWVLPLELFSCRMKTHSGGQPGGWPAGNYLLSKGNIMSSNQL